MNINPDNKEAQEIMELTVRAAAKVMCKAVLDLLQQDPHQWSKRPCGTCHAISSIIQAPFGCVLFNQQNTTL